MDVNYPRFFYAREKVAALFSQEHSPQSLSTLHKMITDFLQFLHTLTRSLCLSGS